MQRIEQWGICPSAGCKFSPYTPPEAYPKGICGKVYGSSRFNDGDEIVTTRVVSAREVDGKIIVKTGSDSEYELGDVHPEYEQQFPGARERVLKMVK